MFDCFVNDFKMKAIEFNVDAGVVVAVVMKFLFCLFPEDQVTDVAGEMEDGGTSVKSIGR